MLRKRAGKAIKDGMFEGAVNVLTDTSPNKTTETVGKSFKEGFVNGAASSMISSVHDSWQCDAIAGAVVGMMESNRGDRSKQDTGNAMLLNSISNGFTSAILRGGGVKAKIDKMEKSDLIDDRVGGGMLNWMTQIFGVGVDTTVKFLGNAL